MDDEFLDIQVRPVEEIAARLLILHALTRRALIESIAAEDEIDEEDDPDDLFFDLTVFLAESGVSPYLTDAEQRILSTSPGELGDATTLSLTENTAALESLTGTILSSPDPTPAVPLETASVASLVESIVVPDDELAAAWRERAELWHWRAETEFEVRQTAGEERRNLLTLIRETATEASTAGLIELTPRGDFDSGGRSLDELDEVELAVFAINARTRLRALNWLCGFGDSWNDAPLDV